MRRQFYSARAAGDGLPEGHLLFDLVTPDRDTYKTRLRPEGARFRPAKPWLDAHGDDSAKRVIGTWEPVIQNAERLRVQVAFDMKDENAAEIYRKHRDGVLDGSSIGFDPIKYHVEDEPDGSSTLVYDEYWVLEGSSCPVPSNPTALMVRSAEIKRADFRSAAPKKIVQFSGETPYDALISHACFDIVEESAFLAMHGESCKTATLPELEAMLGQFEERRRASFRRAALIAATGALESDAESFLAFYSPSATDAELCDAFATTAFIRKSEKTPTTIQTLIFAKDGPHGSAEKAVAWAKKHGFNAAKIDETSESFRLRQKDPSSFADGSLKTIDLTNGVKAVVGRPKQAGAASVKRAVGSDATTASIAANVADLPDNHLGAARRDAATVGTAPQGTFSQQTEGPSMKTHEHRAHHRYMIGDKLRAAQDHMEAIGMHSKEEHRAHHAREAEHNMDGAMHLARMINESIAEGHADAPADAALTAGMIRSVPEHCKTNAAIVAKWDACQRAALPHAGQTFRQAAELLGAGSPEDLVVNFRAQEDIVAAHKKLLSQNRSAEQDKTAKERADLVASLVSGPVGLSPARECEMLGLDPADPKREKRSAAGPWSLERIRKYELAVTGAIPEVQTRAAELRGEDGKAAPQQRFAGNAPGPAAKDNAGQGGNGDFDAAMADAAKRMKISPEKLRAAQDFGRR